MKPHYIFFALLCACPLDDVDDGNFIVESNERCRHPASSAPSPRSLYECTPQLKAQNDWHSPYVITSLGQRQTIHGDINYFSFSNMQAHEDTASTVFFLREAFPAHVQARLDALNNTTNCFFNAINFHLPQATERIMTNTAFAALLDAHFVALAPGEPVRFGDVLTVQAPSEGQLRNYHHAAIVLNEDYLLDKPNTRMSPLRIERMESLYEEWNYSGATWQCPRSEPTIGGYQCLLLKFYRKR